MTRQDSYSGLKESNIQTFNIVKSHFLSRCYVVVINFSFKWLQFSYLKNAYSL